jgi:hypothetical protein
LLLRRRVDVLKIKLAAQLRRETTMTLTWIAEWLQRGVLANSSIYENQTQTGSSSNVSDGLRRGAGNGLVFQSGLSGGGFG